MKTGFPVVIVGAGPVGLAAAAHLARGGHRFVVLEAGNAVGASVLKWGHVRLFSPWNYVVDKEAALLLEQAHWTAPPSAAFPTGREVVEKYLQPLANVPELRPHIRLGSRVVSISRRGIDKMKTSGRDEAPFEVRVEVGGQHDLLLARAVIDASGTYQHPNPLGVGGLPAEDEDKLATHIRYAIPDALGAERERYAGKRVLVVGSGHSAFNALLDLCQLKPAGTRVLWAIRRGAIGTLFGGGKNDKLLERGRLGARIQGLVASGDIELFTAFGVRSLERTEGGIAVIATDDRRLDVDEVIATTGFRPDLDLTRELRLSLDPALESPSQLAPLIDPNVHSCGSVPPHGESDLAHPEKDFYVVGMKSYGRAPTFLMITGYEQIRSIVAALTGDWEAARKVELVLPETGVCSTDKVSCELPLAEASCCPTATAPPPERSEVTLLRSGR